MSQTNSGTQDTTRTEEHTPEGSAVCRESIDDGILLLQYAAHRGTLIDANAANTIIDADRAIRSGKMTDDIEKKFWPAITVITRELSPVTAERVRYSKDYIGNRRQHKRSIAFSYVVLIFLIIFQTYWFIGNTILQNMKDIQVRLEQFPDLVALAPGAGQTQNAPGGDPEADSQAGGNGATAYATERERLIMALIGYANSLYTWGHPLTWIKFAGVDPPQPKSNDGQAQSSGQEARSNVEQEEPIVPMPREIRHKTYFGIPAEYFNTMQNAQVALQILNFYILPVIYGSLGAIVFRIRNISTELDSFTFSRASQVRYAFRFTLGGIAGLAVGWFLMPEQAPLETAVSGSSIVGASLTSLAIAFLAGYSVDLLFSSLDRLVAQRTAPPPAPVALSQSPRANSTDKPTG